MGRALHFLVLSCAVDLGRSRFEEALRVQALGARFGYTNKIFAPIVAMTGMPLARCHLHTC